MAQERVVLSTRINPKINNMLLELVEHYQKGSVGTVTKRIVVEEAILSLYQTEFPEKELKK